MATAKQKIQWIDILRPKESDLKRLGRKFKLHPVILDELKGLSARAHVEVYKNYIYLIYYFPVYDPIEETSLRTEVDFIITKHAVITVRYEELGVLENFQPKAAESPLRLAYYLIQALIHFQERQLRHIGEKTEAIGQELFKNREKEVLQRISRLKRDISEYRFIVKHQGPILSSLLNKGLRFGGEEERPYLEDLIGDHLKIVNHLDDYREAVSDFEGTNDQLMNVKTNEVMRTFTTLSFLTFPFMLIAAIFGMNTADLPLTKTPGAFWMVFGGMAATMVMLVIYFKRKGWI